MNILDAVAEAHLQSVYEKERAIEDILRDNTNHYYDPRFDLSDFGYSTRPKAMIELEDDFIQLYINLLSTLNGGQGVTLAKIEFLHTQLVGHWAALGYKSGFTHALHFVEGKVGDMRASGDGFCDDIDDMDDIVEDTMFELEDEDE